MMHKPRRLVFPSIFFLATATAMLLPALDSGQLFLLDMPWPEQLRLSSYIHNGISSSFPIMAVLKLLTYILPMWLLQKAALLSLLTLCGVGMFYLYKRLNKLSGPASTVVSFRYFRLYKDDAWALLSGTIYMLNPYVLDRLLAGQWLVLAGYAFLPFFARFAYTAYTRPTRRSIAVVCGAWLVYSLISIHWWYIVTLFLLPAVIYTLLRHYRRNGTLLRRSRPSRESGKKQYSFFALDYRMNGSSGNWHLAAMLLALAGVAAWLLITIFRYSKATGHIGTADFTAFATRAIDTLGAWGAVLSLRGFWHSGGIIPNALEPLWLATCGALLIFTGYALNIWYNRHPLRVIYTFWTFVFATVLAVGYASPVGQWVTDIARTVIPGFSGLREPQKMVGLIAFIYALAAPFAMQYILAHKPKRHVAQYCIVVTIASYILCVLFAVTAAHPSLATHHYPREWQTVRATLSSARPQRVLILPWNGYIHLPFADDAFVANPASKYFGVPADTRRSSGNLFLDNARGNTTFDQTALSLKKDNRALSDIRAQGYDYIILLHTEDYLSYKKQLDAAALEIVFAGNTISLYGTKQQSLSQTF